MDEQARAPIWEAMRAYRDRNTSRFHVPGHKGRSGPGAVYDSDDDTGAHVGVRAKADRDACPEEEALLAGMYAVDLTEIPGLDDLHQPEGAIADAQRLAAACYGAERTFFLVGGSTVGNLALILALCKPGDLLLVQRNAHKSVMSGLMLAGARAVFLAPRIDPASGLPGAVAPDDVELALRRHPEAVGLLLTDPNYYGLGADLRPLVEAAHRRAVPVLVDAAHGAHYGFHPALPGSALAAGADAVVHSTHKMLTALTMGAMLHLQGGLLDASAVARALRTLQSSSPSYPILASLDLARRQLRLRGGRLLGGAIAARARLCERLARFAWLRVVAPPPGARLDPLKLTLGDRTGTLGGFALMRELEQDGCVAEMADPNYVVLALGVATDEGDMDRPLQALKRVSAVHALEKKELAAPMQNIYRLSAGPSISAPIPFHYHEEAGDAPHVRNRRSSAIAQVGVREAVGHRADVQLVPYPPGVPLLFAGETITAAHAEALSAWIAAGSRIHGLNEDGTITIRRNGDKP